MSGQIVHIEFPADDTGEARAFWGALFGWQFEAFPGPTEYHMARISETMGGAITNMEPGKHKYFCSWNRDLQIYSIDGQLLDWSLRPGGCLDAARQFCIAR